MSKPKGPDQINCAHCGESFPRGYRSLRYRNFCKPECREEWAVKNAKTATKFTDADAERIFQEKRGAAARAYYSGFVYRARYSSIYGAAEIGGGNRRGGMPI